MLFSVDWKQLDGKEIDEEIENCAQDAIGEFLGVSLPSAKSRAPQSEGHVEEKNFSIESEAESLDSITSLGEAVDDNRMYNAIY